MRHTAISQHILPEEARTGAASELLLVRVLPVVCHGWCSVDPLRGRPGLEEAAGHTSLTRPGTTDLLGLSLLFK